MVESESLKMKPEKKDALLLEFTLINYPTSMFLIL